MTNYELKQLRRLLFLEVSEAAKFIGNCEARTWQRWEKGDRNIPKDVIQTMQMMALTRAERMQFEFDAKDPAYCYFETFAEYKNAGGGGNELMWRLAQSVAAQLLSESAADDWREEETIEWPNTLQVYGTIYGTNAEILRAGMNLLANMHKLEN